MKAVIWTDVFQGVIMIGGVFSILVIVSWPRTIQPTFAVFAPNIS